MRRARSVKIEPGGLLGCCKRDKNTKKNSNWHLHNHIKTNRRWLCSFNEGAKAYRSTRKERRGGTGKENSVSTSYYPIRLRGEGMGSIEDDTNQLGNRQPKCFHRDIRDVVSGWKPRPVVFNKMNFCNRLSHLVFFFSIQKRRGHYKSSLGPIKSRSGFASENKESGVTPTTTY